MGRQKPTHKDASAITREPLNPYVCRHFALVTLQNVTCSYVIMHSFGTNRSQA